MTTPLLKKPWNPIRNQRGSYFAISALALLIIFGFAALGVEAGRWYAVQGELSKSIDGAAFAGAQNVNNPNIPDLNLFVEQVARANFADGLLGTDTAVFVVSNDGNGKISVDGSTNAINTLAKGFNPKYDKTHVATAGSARLRNAEIALVLDVSWSMNGTPITRLKDGSKQFVDNFEDQENQSKFALVTFSTGADVPFDLDHNYVSGGIKTDITNLNVLAYTNAEEALARTNALPWKDQSNIPANERDKQVVVFFSDGDPTAFRGQFTYQDNSFDAVAHENPYTGNTVQNRLARYNQLHSTYPFTTADITGDGKPYWNSACTANPAVGNTHTVKWEIFSDQKYGLDNFGPTVGIDPEECKIQNGNPLGEYTEWVARQKAIDNAQAIKGKDIEIYTIGLGDVQPAYLEQLSSGAGFSYFTTDPDELAGIFQQIANILKLVLVS